jgi:precorrin-6B methylase 2
MATLRFERRPRPAAWLLAAWLVGAPTSVSPAAAQQERPFQPEVGQPGKDVVWVPTPPELVEKMLDLAEVTPSDFVIDLGSGDGRNVVGAAKRGARALGVEFNPDMVNLSKRNAEAAGVGSKATFVQGDMFTADISQASVMALFLLPSNMLQLRSKFLDLKPGSRIVSNTFTIQDWTADAEASIGGDCSSWCTAYLWIVPAKIAGEWRLPNGQLALTQTYQMVSGTLTLGGTATPVTGRLRGTSLTFAGGGREYTGRVDGERLEFASPGLPAMVATRTRQ